VHIFQQEASFRRHLCFRVGRPASPIYIQQPQRPTRQSPNAFLQLLFSRRENTRCIFFSIQNHCFRLDRPTSPTVNPLFIPVPQPSTRQLIPFRRQPADSLLSYFFTEPNASPDHQHIPSGASRPTSPATILSIPAPQSSISQLPSSRLGRPTSYIPSNHFFNIHKASSSHQVLLPTILPKSTNNHLSKTSSRRISVIFPDITPHHSTHLPFSIFPFSISRPTSSRPSSFRTSNSNLIPPLSQRPPLLPSCCRFSNPQAKRET